MRNQGTAEIGMKMYIVSRNTRSWHEQINWSGVVGLAAMAVGSALGWAAIIAGFRAIVH